MKRLIDYDLRSWLDSDERKPLLVRGARQVGKTYAVRQLGKSFENYIEINFELTPEYKKYFIKDLDPRRITKEILYELGKEMIPGETLFFFDEIQEAPEAVKSLRYFHEIMPELPVIAAGSLLDFVIKAVGLSVGRVMSLYVFPLTFMEFLHALDKKVFIKAILEHTPHNPIPEPLHQQFLDYYGEYCAVGGMPEAVNSWRRKGDPLSCSVIHHTIIDAYRQDFPRYAKSLQIKYLNALFDSIPRLLGQRFMYTAVEGEYRKRELEPGLELLETAGVVHKVYHTAGQKLPLGSEVNPDYFKAIFVDCALAQGALGLTMNDWLFNPLETKSNKGALIESLIGQELLGYAYPLIKQQLYYWINLDRGSSAEIDYLVHQQKIVPIEVKSGASARLLSMHSFLNSHPESPVGIRFSTRNYGINGTIHSYPLYAVAAAFPNYSKRVLHLIQ